ncbi:MAG: DoxX family protein [Flavobacteriaceae bacterium]
MKRNKIIYYVATGLLSALMLFSSGMYIFNHEMVSGLFTSFGYPTYIIYPLAVAKLLGLFAIWNPNFKVLKEWAYAGFFFDLILAFFAHYMVSDGGQNAAVIGMLLLIVSYIFSKKITNN